VHVYYGDQKFKRVLEGSVENGMNRR